MALFRRMLRSEQLHALNVLRAVCDQAADTPHDLALAALMHDVGKIRYAMAIWQKSLPVLVRAVSPGLYRRWSEASPEDYWKRPFVVNYQHPAWSADLLRETGASERAVWLVEHHADDLAGWADHPYVGLLERLKRADDLN